MPHATRAVALAPHPATPSAAARSITVEWTRDREGLVVRYVLDADLARVRVPRAGAVQRADGLWRHTCFEMFVAPLRSPGYQEFNFSPSGEWAAYGFSAYRQGGTPLDCPAPRIAVRRSATELEVEAAVPALARGTMRVGFSAVVEETDGTFSYWALRHASDKPDFHHAASFALELDEVRH